MKLRDKDLYYSLINSIYLMMKYEFMSKFELKESPSRFVLIPEFALINNLFSSDGQFDKWVRYELLPNINNHPLMKEYDCNICLQNIDVNNIHKCIYHSLTQSYSNINVFRESRDLNLFDNGIPNNYLDFIIEETVLSIINIIGDNNFTIIDIDSDIATISDDEILYMNNEVAGDSILINKSIISNSIIDLISFINSIKIFKIGNNTKFIVGNRDIKLFIKRRKCLINELHE